MEITVLVEALAKLKGVLTPWTLRGVGTAAKSLMQQVLTTLARLKGQD